MMEFIGMGILLGLVFFAIVMAAKSAKKQRHAKQKQMDDIAESARRLSELRSAARSAQLQDARKVSAASIYPRPASVWRASSGSTPSPQARREAESRRNYDSRRDDDLLNPMNLSSPLNPIYHTPSYEAPAHRSDDCGGHRFSSDSHSSHSGSSSHSCDSGSSSSDSGSSSSSSSSDF